MPHDLIPPISSLDDDDYIEQSSSMTLGAGELKTMLVAAAREKFQHAQDEQQQQQQRASTTTTKDVVDYFAPYSPSPVTLVKHVLRSPVVNLSKVDVVCDLGFGDGRWLFEAVQAHGCRAVGIEWDETLVAKTRAQVEALGLLSQVELIRGDVMTTRLPADTTVVIVYAFIRSLVKLKALLEDQLNPGTRVISVGFHIPRWTVRASFRIEGLACYVFHL